MSFESSKLEGEIAEQMFIDYLKFHGKKFFDARNDKECRLFDIDFITLKNKHNEKEVLKDITNGNYDKRKKRIEEVGCAIEVKLDKVIHNRSKKNNKLTYGTNNFVFEEISHNMPGWAARCYADYILYVCVDTFDDIMSLAKVYLIDLYKLRYTPDDEEYEAVNLDIIEIYRQLGEFENAKELLEQTTRRTHFISTIEKKVDERDDLVFIVSG